MPRGGFCRNVKRESDGGEAVVDEQVRAVDETRLVGREEQRGGRDFRRFAQAALLHRDRRLGRVDTHRLQIPKFAHPVRRADEPRRERVATRLLPAPFSVFGKGDMAMQLGASTRIGIRMRMGELALSFSFEPHPHTLNRDESFL